MNSNGEWAEPTISERAQAARITQRQIDREMDMNAQGQVRLNDALDRALDDIDPIVVADSAGNRSKYVSLKALIKHVTPALRANDLRMSFTVERTYSAEDTGGKTRIMVLCLDLTSTRSGEVARYTYEVPIPKLDPQGTASAFTYGRRMLIEGTFGLAPSDAPYDDDGASARQETMDEDAPDSDLLIELKAEISAIKDKGVITELVSWKNEKKVVARWRLLSPADKERFRVFLSETKRDMLDATET